MLINDKKMNRLFYIVVFLSEMFHGFLGRQRFIEGNKIRSHDAAGRILVIMMLFVSCFGAFSDLEMFFGFGNLGGFSGFGDFFFRRFMEDFRLGFVCRRNLCYRPVRFMSDSDLGRLFEKPEHGTE